MFAELVCLEMTPAKWHGGASIFRGLTVRWANQVTFNLVRQLPPLTRGLDTYGGFDDRAVIAAETGDAAADGSAVRRVRPCGEGSIAPFLPMLGAKLGVDLSLLSHLISIASAAIIDVIVHVTGNS